MQHSSTAPHDDTTGCTKGWCSDSRSSCDANGCPLQAAKGGKKKRKRSSSLDEDEAEIHVPGNKKRQLFAEPAQRNSKKKRSSLLEDVADIWLQQAGRENQF